MSAAAVSANAGSVRWFAGHEARLFWRDAVSLWTAGNPKRAVKAGIALVAIAILFHLLAVWLLTPMAQGGVAIDKTTMLAISGSLVMLMSLMFSQSLESVTRAYYARQDLDLILSSPVPARRLFVIRSAVLAAQTMALSLLISAPVINAMIWIDGARWLGAYPLLISLGALATGVSIGVTLVLFKIAGPRKTRMIAQILSAVIGAGFVIALQGFAIVLGKGYSRFALFSSGESASAMPAVDHLIWLPARAAAGDLPALAIAVVLCAGVLTAAIAISSKRFADDVLMTAGLERTSTVQRQFGGFSKRFSVKESLRRKEWRLLWRDPWLMSQSLQQILYLIPPALLLWFQIGEGNGVLLVAVPVLVMAVGQLAGGLAWITISGEDAHDLVASAPVKPFTLLQAKVEAVLAVIAVLLLPFMAAIAFWSVRAALCLFFGAVCSAACAVVIQLWFRSQATRSMFRRRQVSSRVATICEALVSILCAAGAGLAILHTGLVVVAAIPVALILWVAYAMRPQREA